MDISWYSVINELLLEQDLVSQENEDSSQEIDIQSDKSAPKPMVCFAFTKLNQYTPTYGNGGYLQSFMSSSHIGEMFVSLLLAIMKVAIRIAMGGL